MPSPLPTDFERYYGLNEAPLYRLQAVSFFLFGLLLSALAVQLLWNYLRRDFTKLPRLSYPRALAGVLLWGLLFLIVLTMISGARELMTPGAWKKAGFTYKLVEDPKADPEPSPGVLRKQKLEQLRTALWNFAATHNGRFPSKQETAAISWDLWLVPEGAGLRYQYVPGLTAGPSPTVLVYEPQLDAARRLALLTDGDITALTSSEQDRSENQGTRP
jgi:hypothetical protein